MMKSGILQKYKNNKGFTLVELIIVVAIIAVLAAVLVPQYMTYVERSKESSDLQLATNLIKAANLAMADPQNEIPADTILEVLWVTNTTSSDQRFRGWLLVREAYAGNTGRTSAIKPTDYKQTGANVAKLQVSIFEILGQEAIQNAGTSDWYTVFGDAQSSAGQSASFCFHLDSSTGAIAMASFPTDGDQSVWIDNIGVNLTQ